MMNGDSYKIFISISHHRISFEYWQRDGENKLVPLPYGNWPAPLAFYCSDTGIIIGEDAVRAAHSGIANAFDNYFKCLVEDHTYTLGGQQRPIRNLLLDASEIIFRDFFRHVLFNRFGSLSDNRANMPLTIVCESDIKPYERALLQGLFKDSGYSRVRVVDYNRYINKYISESLSHEYVCNNVVVAWAEGSDLTLSMFGVTNESEPIVKSYERLGIDPRKQYVERMIWDSVLGQNPFFQKSDREEAINKAASDFLSSSRPMVRDTVILSDGGVYHYSLNRNTIDYIQTTDSITLKDTLEKFLKENGIQNKSQSLLLLRGKVAGNSYFEQHLSPGFSKTIKTDKKLRENAMSLIINEVAPIHDYGTPIDKSEPPVIDKIVHDDNQSKIKELSRKWRGVRAEAKGKHRDRHTEAALQMLQDFLSECQSISGTDNLIKEISEEISKFNISSEQVINHELIKSFERQWREIKATAKGKMRSGNAQEARSILQKFLNSVKKEIGTDELVNLIEKELSVIAAEESIPDKTKPKHRDGDVHPNGKWVWVSSAAGGKGDWRVIGGRIHSQAQTDKEPAAKTETDGEVLIAQGKLKEAREWYRSHNNNTMAGTLSEIIRSKKGVDIRMATIDEYRKAKNHDQVARIINEIRHYIDLCEKAGLDSSNYKKILSEYRKI